MKGLIQKMIQEIKPQGEEAKILISYRIISILITSTFYIVIDNSHAMEKKVFIIACLTFSSIILVSLYIKNQMSPKKIKLLILIETIGNSFLLIPSGGLKSPFIWYTLNTILITSLFLNKAQCYLNILAYIAAAGLIIYFFKIEEFTLNSFLINETNLIISFVLVVAVMQVLSVYIKKIKDNNKSLWAINKQLEIANKIGKESIEHIMALYQSVELLHQRTKKDLIKLLIEYTKKITKSDFVLYYDIPEKEFITTAKGDTSSDILQKKINSMLEEIMKRKEPVEILMYDKKYLVIPVASPMDYSILGVEIRDSGEDILYKNILHQLQFLSGLGSLILERFYLEEANFRFLVAEEQNRIANEIHDGVLQRLFGMSCNIFTIIKHIEKYSKEEIKEKLNFIRREVDISMKELREKIYGLSWKKGGINNFLTDINNYIYEMEKLHSIDIDFKILGRDELLNCIQKKALYRIICEGIGNAIRHGEAKEIKVTLNIEPDFCVLKIRDNGKGFELAKVRSFSTGLGINNIYLLSESLKGELDIDTGLGRGTEIRLKIPINYYYEREEEVI